MITVPSKFKSFILPIIIFKVALLVFIFSGNGIPSEKRSLRGTVVELGQCDESECAFVVELPNGVKRHAIRYSPVSRGQQLWNICVIRDDGSCWFGSRWTSNKPNYPELNYD